ncbi:MAG: fibronectin type III domain-containing protein, partial [Anaerolineae bacterium]|nr:fibronectin type III domain-containing protein [Anaerolineae bacterium]
GIWWTFTTRNGDGLGGFGKNLPIDLATGVPTATAVLSWYASLGATSYEVCVGNAPGHCDTSGGWVNVGNTTQWTLPALQSATTYWWQVRAVNASGTTQANNGAWWRFTTMNDLVPAPGPFDKQTPPDGATGVSTTTAQLTWAASANATGYQICIGTQVGLCDVTGSWVNAGGTSYAIALNPSTTYWWQVRALNAGGQTQADNGAWWHFTTAAPLGAPGAFGKTSPANSAADQATNPLLSWGASAGASGYQVCVGSLPGDCSVTGGWANASGTSYALSG